MDKPKAHLELTEEDRNKLMCRFWSKVAIASDSECWTWKAALSGIGYGRFMADGKVRTAHKWLYEQLNGKLPEKMEVCHSCDNRRCVNPAHLWVGTHSQNMSDCVNKGRHPGASKTHCKRGHLFDEINTRIGKLNGQRICRKCMLIHNRNFLERQRKSN